MAAAPPETPSRARDVRATLEAELRAADAAWKRDRVLRLKKRAA